MIDNVIAIIALALSAYATWKTVQFNNRQVGLIKTQEQLNKLLLNKESVERDNEKSANLSASIVKLGSSQYRLRIFNKGRASATNVNLSLSEGSDLVSQSDISRKFPMEVLEPHQSVELSALVYLGSKSKHAVQLTWDDELSQNNEKTVFVTI